MWLRKIQDGIWNGYVRIQEALLNIREKRKVWAIKAVNFCPSDNDVSSNDSNHTEDDKEQNGVDFVESLEHSRPISWLFSNQTVPGSEAFREKNTCKSCPEVFGPE